MLVARGAATPRNTLDKLRISNEIENGIEIIRNHNHLVDFAGCNSCTMDQSLRISFLIENPIEVILEDVTIKTFSVNSVLATYDSIK